MTQNQVDHAFVCPEHGTMMLNHVLNTSLCTFRPAIFVQFLAARNTLFVNCEIPLLLPIVPSRSNARLLVQQGLFLCPSIIDGSIEQSFASYNRDTLNMDEHVIKIVIDGRIRLQILSELNLMNISRTSLFPDLEGYASSLGHELEYRSLDEMMRLR